MDDNSKKEEFSYAYIHAIAAMAGYSLEIKPRALDNAGIDVTVTVPGEIHGKLSPRFDAQIKCTSKTFTDKDKISYPLLVKNYERLRNERTYVEQLLIVVLVPKEIEEWINFKNEENLLRAKAFWLSLKGAEKTKNADNIRVPIPTSNLLTSDSLKSVMEKIAREEIL